MKEKNLWYLIVVLAVINVLKVVVQFLLSEIEFFDILGSLLIISFVASFLFLFFYRFRRYRRIQEMENNFPSLLRDLADGVESGMTLPAAIQACSNTYYGSLTPEIKKTYNQISWGIPLEKALSSMGNRCGSDHIRTSLSIIIDANMAGGEILEGLKATAQYSREMQNIKKERTRSTRTYVLTFYMTFLIFLGIIVVLAHTLLPALSGEMETLKEGINASAIEEVGVSGAGSIIGGGINLSEIKELMFYMCIVEGFFSGIMAGKIGEGSALAGIKHSIILLSLSMVVFYFIV